MRGLTTNVGVHIDEATVIGYRVYVEDDRVTVEFQPAPEECRGCRVTVFADRADLVRLRDALSGVLDELTAAREAWLAERSAGREAPQTAA